MLPAARHSCNAADKRDQVGQPAGDASKEADEHGNNKPTCSAFIDAEPKQKYRFGAEKSFNNSARSIVFT